MRIAVDTNGLFTTQAGVARYIRGLLRGLERAPAVKMSISRLAWEVENFNYQQPRRALKTFYRELIWSRTTARTQLRVREADVYHATASLFVEPPPPTRLVATLHDLAVLRHPERFRRWQRWSEQRRLHRLLRAERILCVSQFTADEAIALLGLSAARLEVVHNGGDFHSEEPVPAETPPPLSLPAEFFLFVGSLEPGKNLALLKESYRLARMQGKSLPPLVIVGARWEGVTDEGAPPTDWHYLGRQPDAVLVHLYRRGLALVFPSKYEGFGLPVVEAMSLGCPVICSRVASLPEVGGDAAIYAGLDAGSYLDAMRRLVNEPADRRDLVARGKTQSEKFSWRRCAEETSAVYRQALGAACS